MLAISDVFFAVLLKDAANLVSAVLNPVPIPESILKKRKTADQAATERKSALAERKKVRTISRRVLACDYNVQS